MNTLDPQQSPQSAKIGVLTLFTEEIREYAEITVENKKAYCDRHGYDFNFSPNTLDPTRPPSWSKILLLRRYLEDHEWLFWTDADSLFINQSVKLEQFIGDAFDLRISADRFGLNAGQFLIRNTPACIRFLDQVYRQENFVDHPCWEQAAMQALLRRAPATLRFSVVDQRLFNSYPSNFRRGDFVIHFAGCDGKLKLIQQYGPLAFEKSWQRGAGRSLNEALATSPTGRRHRIIR